MSSPFPSKQDLLEFINSNPNKKVGKREIARAFNIKSADRIKLKDILRELSEEGLIKKGHRKSVVPKDGLPPVAVLNIVSVDDHGDLLCSLADAEATENPPKIILFSRQGKRNRTGQFGVGDRVLARLTQLKKQLYEAKPIKKLERRALQFVGVFRQGTNGQNASVLSIERKSKKSFPVDLTSAAKIEDGAIVIAESADGPRYAPQKVRIKEVIGNEHDSSSISLIAIHAHGLPNAFPKEVLKDADAAKPPVLNDANDYSYIPLITIDPETARDFDDAVHAEPDDSPKNEGGWIVTVAIADVAHYVRVDAPLDLDAKSRGNSTYFPDRVVPMLPERLSNDLCSLRPDEMRSSLGVRMTFTATGRKINHQFFRGYIRSRARLSYAQAQSAIDGTPDEITQPLLEPILKPLWAAYSAVKESRNKRAPLDLEMPEYKIELGEDGHVSRVKEYERFDAHKLIEEFMIQANVSAAETLDKKNMGFLFRIHDAPSADKIEALRDTLKSVGLNLTAGQVLKPSMFNGLLKQVRGKDYEKMINEMVLRTQMQAIYSPDNLGHFGLNLRRYTHFTSPIRRYADLIVHRALIRALGLGEGGLSDEDLATLEQTAQHISFCERRSMAAERETVDRFIASFLADRVGATFTGKISGVSKFGLFVELMDSGADGLVPMRSLRDDRYYPTAGLNALVGDRHGGEYRLGQTVEVKLAEVETLSGAIQLELLSDPVTPSGQTRPKKAGPRKYPKGRPSKSKSRRKR